MKQGGKSTMYDEIKNQIGEATKRVESYKRDADRLKEENAELSGYKSKYDEFNKKGYSSVADVTTLVEGLRKSINDKNAELATAKETTEEYRKSLNNLVSDVANALGCRQDTVEIITFAKKAGETAGELEDLQTAFAVLKNESESTQSNLNAEIARLKALLSQKDVLTNVKFEELLKEIVRRLVAILKAK